MTLDQAKEFMLSNRPTFFVQYLEPDGKRSLPINYVIKHKCLHTFDELYELSLTVKDFAAYRLREPMDSDIVKAEASDLNRIKVETEEKQLLAELKAKYES